MILHVSSSKQNGFTLVELLIVVIILAILAAIIVPQFSAATDDAKDSAYDSNISNLRSAIDLYRQQHTAYPGAVAAVDGGCPTGSTAVLGAINTEAAFLAQMQNYTNAAGEACTGTDSEFKYGPYLKDDLPVNPKGTVNTVAIETAGVLGLTTASGGGWLFDVKTGEFIGDEAP